MKNEFTSPMIQALREMSSVRTTRDTVPLRRRVRIRLPLHAASIGRTSAAIERRTIPELNTSLAGCGRTRVARDHVDSSAVREVVDAIGEPERALGFEHQPRRSLLAHLLHEVVLGCDDSLI